MHRRVFKIMLSFSSFTRKRERRPAAAIGRVGGKRQGQPYLNRSLSMFKALIRVSRVDGGIRSFAAAPRGPETRPLVSASAASIVSRSVRASTFKAGDDSIRD